MRVPEAGDAADAGGVKGRFEALKYRDYSLMFVTGGISNVGNWMEIVLRTWLVYEISGGSPWVLGLSNLVHWLPFLLLSPLAGVFADRWEKRWLLVVTQSILTLVTTMLGVLSLLGIVKIWHILLLTFIHGLSEATDNPARTSLVSDLVDKGTLMNAVSLNATAFYGTRLIGPAIGGFLIAAAGTGLGFIINALTFVPYIVALFFIRPAPSVRPQSNPWENFKEGLGYVSQNRAALTILIVVGIISVFMVSYQSLLPIFADDILRAGPEGLGMLSAATGLGAVMGSLLLAFYSHRVVRQGRFICLMGAVFGLALLVFAFSKVYWFSLLCLVVAGAGNPTFASSGNAVLLTDVPAHLRGRIMGVFTMISQGSNVFGSLMIGGLGSAFGAAGGLAISSAVAVIAAAVSFALLPGTGKLGKPSL